MAVPSGMCRRRGTDLQNAIAPHSTSHPSVFTITELKLLGPSLVPHARHRLSVRAKVASRLLLFPEDIEEPHHLPVMVWRVCLETGSWGTRADLPRSRCPRSTSECLGFATRGIRARFGSQKVQQPRFCLRGWCGPGAAAALPILAHRGLTLWVRDSSQGCTSSGSLLPSPSSFSGSWARLMPISAVKGTSRSAPASLRLEGGRDTPGQICPCSLPLNIFLSFPTLNSADFKLNTRHWSNCPK